MSRKAKTLLIDKTEDHRDITESSLARKGPHGMHEEHEARLRFETLIADLSLKFLNLPANEVDHEIEDAQRRVCQCLGRTVALTLRESERAQILCALQETSWRIRGSGGAAEILGIKPTTLEARMAKLGVKRAKGDSNIS